MAWKILAVLMWLVWIAAVVGAISYYPRVEPGMQFPYVLFAAPCLGAMLPLLYLFTGMCFMNLEKLTPDDFI